VMSPKECIVTLLSAKLNQADAIGHWPNGATVKQIVPMKGWEYGDVR
jgi:hypothetical protein